MRKYIEQIFYEGLGRSIYLPIEKLISKINNKNIRMMFTLFVKCLYFVIAIIIAFMLFYFVV